MIRARTLTDARQQSHSNSELNWWIFMRISGLILVFLILWPYARKARPRLAVGAMFTLLYGCARFFTEYFREPDYEVMVGPWLISAGQMLSLPMIMLGGFLLFIAYKKSSDQPLS